MLVLDSGTSTPADGSYLPFDSLSLDGNSLVYRASSFDAGWRDTRVKLVQLDIETAWTIGAASAASGRQILRCSIDRQLIAWDVQINSQRTHTIRTTRVLNAWSTPPEVVVVDEPYPQFPQLTEARYSLYTYQLDSSKLAFGASPERSITLNDDYYAPFVYQGTLLAVRQIAPSLAWTDQPVGPSGSNLWVNYRTYGTAIVQINPAFGDGRILVRAHQYSRLLVAHYANLRAPRTTQRDSIHVGKRLLTWKSNVAERHIVFDMGTYTFIELPVFFADAYSDELAYSMLVKEIDASGRDIGGVRVFYYYPNLLNIRVTPIDGLDADYLYFEHIHGFGKPYLLRIG